MDAASLPGLGDTVSQKDSWSSASYSLSSIKGPGRLSGEYTLLSLLLVAFQNLKEDPIADDSPQDSVF